MKKIIFISALFSAIAFCCDKQTDVTSIYDSLDGVFLKTYLTNSAYSDLKNYLHNKRSLEFIQTKKGLFEWATRQCKSPLMLQLLIDHGINLECNTATHSSPFGIIVQNPYLHDATLIISILARLLPHTSSFENYDFTDYIQTIRSMLTHSCLPFQYSSKSKKKVIKKMVKISRYHFDKSNFFTRMAHLINTHQFTPYDTVLLSHELEKCKHSPCQPLFIDPIIENFLQAKKKVSLINGIYKSINYHNKVYAARHKKTFKRDTTFFIPSHLLKSIHWQNKDFVNKVLPLIIAHHTSHTAYHNIKNSGDCCLIPLDKKEPVPHHHFDTMSVIDLNNQPYCDTEESSDDSFIAESSHNSFYSKDEQKDEQESEKIIYESSIEHAVTSSDE